MRWAAIEVGGAEVQIRSGGRTENKHFSIGRTATFLQIAPEVPPGRPEGTTRAL